MTASNAWEGGRRWQQKICSHLLTAISPFLQLYINCSLRYLQCFPFYFGMLCDISIFSNFSPIVFSDTCNIFNMFETIETIAILDAEFILQTITCNICNSFYLILFYIHSCQSAIHFDLHSNVLINALESCI